MKTKSSIAVKVMIVLASCFLANTICAQSKQATTKTEKVNSDKGKSEKGQAVKKSDKDGRKVDAKKDDAKQDPNFWMDRKLKFSKEILTGLANADFEQIEKNARLMRGLNRIEAFMRGRKEGYRDQLKQFNMANDAILEAAETDNLEAATLGFNRLTISCVSCHKHLRSPDDSPESKKGK